MKFKKILACILSLGILSTSLLCGCRAGGTSKGSSESSETETSSEEETESETQKETEPSATLSADELMNYIHTDPSTTTYSVISNLDLKLALEGENNAMRPNACAFSEDALWILEDDYYLCKYDPDGQLLEYTTIPDDLGFFSTFDRMFVYEDKLVMYGIGDYQDPSDIILVYDTSDGTWTRADAPDTPGPSSTRFEHIMGISSDGILYLLKTYYAGNNDDIGLGESLIIGMDLSGEIVFQTDPSYHGIYGGWLCNGKLYALSYDQKKNTTLILFDEDGHAISEKQLSDLTYVENIYFENDRAYLTDWDGFWQWDEESGSWINLFIWDSVMDDDYIGDFVCSPDGTRYCSYGWSSAMAKLWFPGEDPSEGRTIIQLASWGIAYDYIEAYIDEFNTENTDYYIRVFDLNEKITHDPGFNAAASAGQEEFNEFVNDFMISTFGDENAPVIYLRSPKYEFSGLDMAEDPELWLDLLTLWDEEDASYKEQFIPNLVEYYEQSDAVYSMPYYLCFMDLQEYDDIASDIDLTKAVGPEGNYTSWLKALQDNGFNLLSEDLSSDDLFRLAISTDYEEFFGDNAGAISDNIQFLALLEICKSYALTYSQIYAARNSAKSAVRPDYCDLGYQEMWDISSAKYTLCEVLAFPSVSGVKPVMTAENFFHISAMSSQEEQEGAWEFYKFMVSRDFSGMTLSSLDYNIDLYEHPENHPEHWIYGASDELRGCTPEEAAARRERVLQTSRFNFGGNKLTAILTMDALAYFENQLTLDQVLAQMEEHIKEFKG